MCVLPGRGAGSGRAARRRRRVSGVARDVDLAEQLCRRSVCYPLHALVLLTALTRFSSPCSRCDLCGSLPLRFSESAFRRRICRLCQRVRLRGTRRSVHLGFPGGSVRCHGPGSWFPRVRDARRWCRWIGSGSGRSRRERAVGRCRGGARGAGGSRRRLRRGGRRRRRRRRPSHDARGHSRSLDRRIPGRAGSGSAAEAQDRLRRLSEYVQSLREGDGQN